MCRAAGIVMTSREYRRGFGQHCEFGDTEAVVVHGSWARTTDDEPLTTNNLTLRLVAGGAGG